MIPYELTMNCHLWSFISFLRKIFLTPFSSKEDNLKELFCRNSWSWLGRSQIWTWGWCLVSSYFNLPSFPHRPRTRAPSSRCPTKTRPRPSESPGSSLPSLWRNWLSNSCFNSLFCYFLRLKDWFFFLVNDHQNYVNMYTFISKL